MSANVGRREALAGAAGAAVVAPLLRPGSASAASLIRTQKAPVVEFFDERDGCGATTSAYNPDGVSPRKTRGGKAGDDNDKMCVKVSMQVITPSAKLTSVVKSNYADLDPNG